MRLTDFSLLKHFRPMNILISQIFNRIQYGEESVQWDAALQILMLLERALEQPGMDEELCASILSEDLLALDFSAVDGEEILEEIANALDWDGVCRSTKITLLGILLKMSNLKYAEVLLQFFLEHAHTFNEQEAFSSSAGLTQFILRCKRQDISRLQSLLDKYNILPDLENFRTNHGPRLQESAGWLINCLKQI